MPEKGDLKTRLSEALNIEEGEHLPVLFLFIHSFFLGIIVAFYYTASVDLFLKYYDGSDIAWGYVAAGILGLVISRLYNRLGKRLAFSKLLVANLLFLLVSIGIFRVMVPSDPVAAATINDRDGVLAFVIFIWFNLIIYLTAVAFWGLAGRFFNLRQAKRLNALISTGDVVSGILGYLAVPLLLQLDLIKKADLLTICTVALLAWLAFLLVTIRRYKHVIDAEQTIRKQGPEPQGKALRFFKDRYATLVFLLALLPVFVLWYLDIIFLDLTDDVAKNGTLGTLETASFLGIVYGVIKAAELVLKTSLSGKLLRRHGTKLLAALPAMLAFCAVLAVLFGLAMATDRFGVKLIAIFASIILAKVCDRSIRASINDPAFQILYQPIPVDQRLHFQNRIEGGPRQWGIVLAGVLVLALEEGFSRVGNGDLDAAFLLLKVTLLLVILLSWLGAARMMYRAYRREVERILQDVQPGSTRSARSAATLEALKEKLKHWSPEMRAYVLRLLVQRDPASIEGFLVDLLDHPVPEVRHAALQELEHLPAPAALEAITDKATSDADAGVRQAALQTGRVLTEMQDRGATSDALAALVQSADAEQQRCATVLLGYAADPTAQKLLLPLLNDKNHTTVRRAALVAAGRTRNPDLWPAIIDHLATPLDASAAASTLIELGKDIKLGEEVLSRLERFFGKMSDRPRVLMRIINIYGRIGGPKAEGLLWEQVNFPDEYVVFEVFQALRLCNYQAPEEGQERALIRKKIREIADNITWSLAGLRDLEHSQDVARLRAVLEAGIKRDQERLFLLLSLSYDANRIDLVQDRVTEEGPEAKIFALELMDLFMPKDIKDIILPILEDATVTRRLRGLEPNFPQQSLTHLGRLKDIINREYTRVDRWTKACALEALALSADGQVYSELRANLFNPDPMLRETAVMGIYQIDPQAYRRELQKLGRKQQLILGGIVEKAAAYNGDPPRLMLTTEKVAFLSRADIFAEIPEVVLAALVSSVKEETKAHDDTFIIEGDTDIDLYLVIDGRVRLDAKQKTLDHLEAPIVIGEMAVLMDSPRHASAITEGSVRLFRFSGETFFELVFDRFELTGELILQFGERWERLSAEIDPETVPVAP